MHLPKSSVLDLLVLVGSGVDRKYLASEGEIQGHDAHFLIDGVENFNRSVTLLYSASRI